MRTLFYPGTRLLVVLFAVSGITGCQKNAPSSTTPGEETDYLAGADEIDLEEGSTMEVEGTLGTVDEHDVEDVINGKMASLTACYELALEDLDIIEGQLMLSLQIDERGRAVNLFVRSGDLGSIEAESCILKKIEKMQFPRSGGGIAHIDYPLAFEAPYDPPEPEDWSESRVNHTVKAHRSDVDQCLKGQSGVLITVYIEAGGIVTASGAAADDVERYEAANCLAWAVRNWTFDSPSVEAAKVSISF